ncbi:tetratricopeptide repeat protein [Actinocrispum sp. NPDC049592]|uniref:tetratricopeptide repeat protein n=1 Tax=Actinocrispum sp. NPDC049592 TaxID=3154835 RepID=UPI0034173B48
MIRRRLWWWLWGYRCGSSIQDQRGDEDGAIQQHEYPLDLARRSGHNYSTAVVLNNFGQCHGDRGRYAAASDCLRQSLTMAYDQAA